MRLLLLFALALACLPPTGRVSSAQEAPTNRALDEARLLVKTWRKEHLEQQARALEFQALNARVLRLRAEGKTREDPEVKELELATAGAFKLAREAQRKAASTFIITGQAVDKALSNDPEALDAHAWRAELLVTLANSGRSIGAVLGDEDSGLLSFGLFEKGLASASRARLANPKDPTLCALEARLLMVFNDFSGAISILEPLRVLGKLAQRESLALATAQFYKADYNAALATIDALPQAAKQRKDASDLRAVIAKTQEIAAAEAKVADDLPRILLAYPAGEVVIELFEDEAPNTVAHVIQLVESGFYVNTRMHRVLSAFIAQGGDPLTRPDGKGRPGTGGPGYRVPDELGPSFRHHLPGRVALARSSEADSGGSQFYVSLVPLPYLDGEATVFGQVISGLEVIGKLRGSEPILATRVLRKRDHPYKARTLPLANPDLDPKAAPEDSKKKAD
jgi:peptidyl-prolyl cis-trans isomerase B (cyclophilin B)